LELFFILRKEEVVKKYLIKLTGSVLLLSACFSVTFLLTHLNTKPAHASTECFFYFNGSNWKIDIGPSNFSSSELVSTVEGQAQLAKTAADLVAANICRF